MLSVSKNKELYKDIIEWDVVNWGKFIDFIESQHFDFRDKLVLEIGARNGGLSLYFALKGGKCICSDIAPPSNSAKAIHKKYNVQERIEYKTIDATGIPEEYNNKFDYVVFKSVLGGIGRSNNLQRQRQCTECINRVLKKDGKVLFAENMQGTFIHSLSRRMLRHWGSQWHYETEGEIENLFSSFTLIDRAYFGFFGCFGPNESWKKIFGKFDSLISDKIFPDQWKYIGTFIYQK